MSLSFHVGDCVVLRKLPSSVRDDDPDDDIFRRCLGMQLTIVSIEENGDLQLDVSAHSDRTLSIYVPPECVDAVAA
jgi:hypothetical protein